MSEELPTSNQPAAAAPPTTTHEQDRATAGQRQINRVWEYTQCAIAITVVSTGMSVGGMLSLGLMRPTEADAAGTGAFLMISNTMSLVIGFYFGRTNHQRTGGVGSDEKGR